MQPNEEQATQPNLRGVGVVVIKRSRSSIQASLMSGNYLSENSVFGCYTPLYVTQTVFQIN